jgi:plasmid stabilization system protein ParE
MSAPAFADATPSTRTSSTAVQWDARPPYSGRLRHGAPSARRRSARRERARLRTRAEDLSAAIRRCPRPRHTLKQQPPRWLVRCGECAGAHPHHGAAAATLHRQARGSTRGRSRRLVAAGSAARRGRTVFVCQVESVRLAQRQSARLGVRQRRPCSRPRSRHGAACPRRS